MRCWGCLALTCKEQVAFLVACMIMPGHQVYVYNEDLPAVKSLWKYAPWLPGPG